MKNHTLLLVAGAVGILYLMGRTSGAAAAGYGYPAGALDPQGFPVNGGAGYQGGMGTAAGNFVQSLFGQFGNAGGGGSPYQGLRNILPVNYGGSPYGSPTGSPYGTAPGTVANA